MVCKRCGTENPNRNYYCVWCEYPLKKTVYGEEVKKYKNKHNYLFELDIVVDSSKDIDFFEAYKSKTIDGKKDIK